MNLHGIVYKPRLAVDFTQTEVEELYNAARAHYDWHCRTFAAEFETVHLRPYTQYGYSFLTGLKNRFANGTAKDTVRAENIHFEVIDTLCKIAESPLVQRETAKALWDLMKRYNELFDLVNEKGAQ